MSDSKCIKQKEIQVFNELGTLKYDGNLRRHIYTEEWPDDSFDHKLYEWINTVLVTPSGADLPHYIEDVRYVESRFDPWALELKGRQTVVLGLSPSQENDQMRASDRLDDEEIKIELEFGYMEWELTITLVEDMERSIGCLSDLLLFIQKRQQQLAA
jgi:hypothetical protein